MGLYLINKSNNILGIIIGHIQLMDLTTGQKIFINSFCTINLKILRFYIP